MNDQLLRAFYIYIEAYENVISKYVLFIVLNK